MAVPVRDIGMLAETTLFTIFRWQLSIVCTIYAVIMTWQWLYGWLVWFGSSRQTAALGRYASVLLVRIKIRRFSWELLQIAALCAIFMGLVYLHPSWSQTAH